jgi:uncharacterized protein YecE (DUF72 family)
MGDAHSSRGRLHVGTSGFEFDHWRGPFYPPDLDEREWFPYYARHFDTVEVNNTFYRLPEAAAFEAWRRQAPLGFRYALKLDRAVSQLEGEPEPALGRFCERARLLGDHLGPVLIQPPRHLHLDLDRLEGLLAALPQDLSFAVELSNPLWLCPEVYAALARHRVALCIHDRLPAHPRIGTTGWRYLRFHGARRTGAYPHSRLQAEAGRIRDELHAGRDVFAFFGNDAEGFAVENALELRYLVGS